MSALAELPTNLFSTRIPRLTKPMNIVDYIAARRGTIPIWGAEGKETPQWHAATELGNLGVYDTVKAQLLTDLRTASTTLKSSSLTPQSIVERYLADVTVLNSHRDALNAMLDAIVWNQTFIFYPLGAEGELAMFGEKSRVAFVDELRGPGRNAGQLGASVVTADLVAGGREQVFAVCQADIHRRVETLARHVWQSLVDGVANGLLGVVVWPSADACWYVRTEHRLVLKKEARSWMSADLVQVRQSYEQWLACKEVHLMDAMQVQGFPGWLEPPERVANVARAIPRMLHPLVGTVIGTMIRCREIQWFVGDREYTHEHIQPQQRPIMDPAIVIGSVVLTGWESEHFRPGWWAKLDMMLAGA